MPALSIRFCRGFPDAQERAEDHTVMFLLDLLLPQNGIVGAEEGFERWIGRATGALTDTV